jgi:hypothetical protein
MEYVLTGRSGLSLSAAAGPPQSVIIASEQKSSDFIAKVSRLWGLPHYTTRVTAAGGDRRI